MFTDILVDKEDVVDIYKGILGSLEKDVMMPFETMWMDLEGILLRGISQTEKDKYYMTLLIQTN